MVSQKRLIELFNYNEETGVLTRKVNVGNCKKDSVVGNKHSLGYLRVRIDKQLYFLHRVVWIYVHGDGSLFDKEIDHIDRNKTNNRIKNLRLVTRTTNNRNIGLRKNNTSGFNGIEFHKRRRKWLARIKVNNVSKDIGFFDNIEDAVKAREKAEKELWSDIYIQPIFIG